GLRRRWRRWPGCFGCLRLVPRVRCRGGLTGTVAPRLVPGSRCLLTLVLPALVMPPGFDPTTRLWGGRLGLVRSLAQRTVDDLHRSVPVGAGEGQDGGDLRRGVVIAETRRSGAFPGTE